MTPATEAYFNRKLGTKIGQRAPVILGNPEHWETCGGNNGECSLEKGHEGACDGFNPGLNLRRLFFDARPLPLREIMGAR